MAANRRGWALLAVSLATFMTYLDNNIVNVALPAIERDLHLTTAGLEWVVSAYILLFAGLLLAGGRLADLYGQRRALLAGLAVFSAASLAAGLANSDTELITARAVQGLGAALMGPTTLAIISTLYPQTRERARAVGTWSAVGAVALALGPLLGGALSQHLSWGWIFFVNAPIGVATIGLAIWAIPADARTAEAQRIDVPGLTAASLALFSLTYALIEGHDKGWTSATILTSFAVAAAALVAFIVVERRASAPMVDVALFADRVLSGGIAAIVMWGFGLFGIYFFTSIYMQNVLGFSATVAGAAFVPMAVLMIISSVLADRVAAAIGAHRSTAVSMFLMAAGMASLTLLGRDASFISLMPSFALVGIGGGLTVPLTAMILGAMPPARVGVAAGIFNAAREVSGLLGITVIGAILTTRQSAAIRAGHSVVDAYLTGYRTGLFVAAALVASGGVAGYFALRHTYRAPSERAHLPEASTAAGAPDAESSRRALDPATNA